MYSLFESLGSDHDLCQALEINSVVSYSCSSNVITFNVLMLQCCIIA